MHFVVYRLFLLLSLTSIDVLNAIRCYQCGTESIFMLPDPETEYVSYTHLEEQENILLTLESCSNLEFPFSSWGSYAVDCAPGQICAKTIIDQGSEGNGRSHYVTASRGCAMRNTSQGREHQMGCGILRSNAAPPTETFQTKWDLVCFCDSDYCNGGPRKSALPCKTVGFLFIISFIFSLTF